LCSGCSTKKNLRLDMDQARLRGGRSLVKFEKAILKPYGMVLVTGPTGSGKTNTLYSSISRLNQPDTNIMTAGRPGRVPTGRREPGADEGAESG